MSTIELRDLRGSLQRATEYFVTAARFSFLALAVFVALY